MRWIWTLAIACIIAATGVRPELEVRDDPTSQQLTAPASLQHLVARPHGHGAPDTRVSLVAAVAARFALFAPPAHTTLETWHLRPLRSHLLVDARARGPPPSIG